APRTTRPTDRTAHDDYFFFQAEDGIRDATVTEFRRVLFRSGVDVVEGAALGQPLDQRRGSPEAHLAPADVGQLEPVCPQLSDLRSEERRVGKEGRAQWAQGNRTREKTRVDAGD